MGEYQSGQMGQMVNLLASKVFIGLNPVSPTMIPNVQSGMIQYDWVGLNSLFSCS
jgi:hypothetical protein